MIFTWNEENAALHYKKHGISFSEAVTVFDDPFSITEEDTWHGEYRFTRIGMSAFNCLLRVTYSEEGNDVRIISARKASPANRKKYMTGLL